MQALTVSRVRWWEPKTEDEGNQSRPVGLSMWGMCWGSEMGGGCLDYAGHESSPPLGCASDITVVSSGDEGNSLQMSFTDGLGR